MTDTNKNEFIFDETIPVETQVTFLRKACATRDVAMYKVLTERLGEEKGKEMYWAIREYISLYAMGGTAKKVPFDQIKKMVGVPDKMLGYKVEKKEEAEDEVLMSFENCPALEMAKQHGLEKKVCSYMCEREREQVKQVGCEMTILARIADGAEKCRFRIRPTK